MIAFEQPIHVTRPALPPLAEFAAGLREIWDRRWLTNGGPVLARLERRLAETLQAPRLNLFTNGALALQLAFQGMRLEGEVITTPFSFAATTNAIVQCGLTPVFADIEPHFLTLDPDRVEALVTPRTSAILAVHVFGLPCALDRLRAIAERHGLALIYDAAHAFGTTVGGRSIATFGDATMFSFHATKLFHSIEGGALAYRDPALKPRIDALCNHGLSPDGDVERAGTNAKMSEVQALMGELMLAHVPAAIAHGARVEATYRDGLADVDGLAFLPRPAADIRPNHSFAPMLVDRTRFGLSADRLHAQLRRYNVFARRYFRPLISDMTAFRQYCSGDPLTRARRVVQDVIALPSYADLPLGDVARICDMVRELGRQHAGQAELTPVE